MEVGINLPTTYIGSENALEDLLHQKTRIVSTKLEVIALAINERLGIWNQNLKRIEEDQGMLAYMLEKLARGVNYRLREHSEKRVFYEQIFELRKQVREEDVECWRDIVLVMRDFLVAWEAHEQAKAKATFLDK
jgi:hypothetical protein